MRQTPSSETKGDTMGKGWKVLTPKQVADEITSGRFDKGTGWILADGKEKLGDGSEVGYSLQIGVDYSGKISIILLVGRNGDDAEVMLEHGDK
jgi:hypothetical protein